jgi:hypothetical protein
MHAKANRWWPGWNSTLIELPPDVLVSEAKSRTYGGLWLREPKQFLHDAMPRAELYLDRILLNSECEHGRLTAAFVL